MTQTEEQDLLQLQNFLTYRLARVQARLNAQAVRLLKETAGINLSQWRVIAMIGSGGDDTVLAADLKRIMGFDKGLFSRTVRGLMADGLVTSAVDERDQRCQRLALTNSGRALYNSTLPVMRARQERLQDALDADELVALLSGLDKLETAASAGGHA
ncbi:MAG: MarR family winged helix-turn-helix transcriptional regulator [Pseudomonadota bacterium]